MAITDRTDASALMPEEVVDAFIDELPEYSTAATSFRTVRMARGQDRIPVLSTLPTAYFVNGEASNDGGADPDAGYKRTTRMAWGNKTLNVEEIAAIIPVPIAVLEDSEFDLVELFKKEGPKAIGAVLDAAVLFGTNKPTTWGDDVVTHATNAGHIVTIGTASAADGGLAEDYNELFGLIEEDGYNPSQILASIRHKADLRGHRDSEGRRQPEITVNEVDGVPVTYPAQGQWPSTVRSLVVDTSQGVLGIRWDVTADILREAVIQDPTDGSIILNLAQQNAVAVRFSARFAWQVASTVNRENAGASAGSVSPFGVLSAAAS